MYQTHVEWVLSVPPLSGQEEVAARDAGLAEIHLSTRRTRGVGSRSLGSLGASSLFGS